MNKDTKVVVRSYAGGDSQEVYDINTYLPNDAKVAADEINAAWKTGREHARATILEVIKIGEILTVVKNNLSHGEFRLWIIRNCPFKPRSAQNYMRLADRLRILAKTDPAKAQRVADLSYRDAMKLLATPKEAPVFNVGTPVSSGLGYHGSRGRGFEQRTMERPIESAPATDADLWDVVRKLAEPLGHALEALATLQERHPNQRKLVTLRKLANNLLTHTEDHEA